MTAGASSRTPGTVYDHGTQQVADLPATATRAADSAGAPSLGGALQAKGPRMRVGGILETALYVADLPRSAEFYRRLFGFGFQPVGRGRPMPTSPVSGSRICRR